MRKRRSQEKKRKSLDELTTQDTLSFLLFVEGDSVAVVTTHGLHRERRYLVISSHSTFPCVTVRYKTYNPSNSICTAVSRSTFSNVDTKLPFAARVLPSS